MKSIDKIILFLLFLSILIVAIGYFSAPEKNDGQEDENVQCFNQVCNKYDKPYCLNCNLSCKPEFCDSDVVVLCENCSEEQQNSLPRVFEKMKEVHN